MAACFCPTDDYYIEQTVCAAADMVNNEMRHVHMDDDQTLSLLLIKQNDEFRAIGSKCPHYGAQLSLGALGNGRVRCPLHGACFRTRNGDVEDYPGLDSLPSYPVTVERGMVKVRARHSVLLANRRLRDMVRRNLNNGQCYVLLGGGPASAVCAETLRQQGFDGRIVMVCQEPCLPYDRVKVTKAMDMPLAQLQLRKEAFYEEYGIELRLGVEAMRVQGGERTVQLSTGELLLWDKLFVGTGARAATLSIKGADHPNVRTMRSHADAAFVNAQLGATKHVVCVGSSFIALEAAAFCVRRCAKVTVIGRAVAPLCAAFGPIVGQRVQRFLEESGVEFVLDGASLEECVVESGNLVAVRLVDGTTIKCDLVILGIGVVPNSELLRGSGVTINDNGTINVNVYMQTNIPQIYAGGDIVNAPVAFGEPANIGHYGLAQYHGRLAGTNMTGMRTTARPVPYFWTTMLGKSFRYAGWPTAQRCSSQVVGSMEELRFVVIYYDASDRVVGMVSCQHDPVVSRWAEVMAQGEGLTKAALAADPLAWMKEAPRKRFPSNRCEEYNNRLNG